MLTCQVPSGKLLFTEYDGTSVSELLFSHDEESSYVSIFTPSVLSSIVWSFGKQPPRTRIKIVRVHEELTLAVILAVLMVNSSEHCDGET